MYELTNNWGQKTMKKGLMIVLLLAALSVNSYASDLQIVQETISKLKSKYAWVESYSLNSWDCSTQSTNLWHILKEKNIPCKVTASVYFDPKEGWKDHIFLVCDLDKKLHMIDATKMEIRDVDFLKYGYYVVRMYDNPNEAEKVWPGEYRWFDMSSLERKMDLEPKE